MTDTTKQVLADVLESLKHQEETTFSLAADVSGLKATLTGHDRDLFNNGEQKERKESAAKHDERLRSLDAVIERLRKP